MIYILKFSKKLGNEAKSRGTAQFYVGYCKDGRFEKRFAEHLSGRGAAIIAAAIAKGIEVTPIAFLPGDRKVERQIKNMKNTPRFVAQLERQGLLLVQ